MIVTCMENLNLIGQQDNRNTIIMANKQKKSNLDSINEEAFFVHKQTFQAHIPNAANFKCEFNIQKKKQKH